MKRNVMRSWMQALMIPSLLFGTASLSTGCGSSYLSEEQAIEQEKQEAEQEMPARGAETGDDANDGGGTPGGDT